MYLAIDIGNTHTVYGLYENDVLTADWRVVSAVQRTEDEIGSQLLMLLHDRQITPETVRGVGISSVVPNLTDVFAAMSRKYFDVEPMIVSSSLPLGIAIHYKSPRAVGADRLCNAVAGYAGFGGPLIVIDFGTATTFDVIAANGDYLGGVIAPGIETSAMDLHRRAAKLPKIELHFPDHVLGTDTEESMQAGILYGALDAMEAMVERLQKEIVEREGKPARVIATGGFSSFLAKHSTAIEQAVPSLVLDGIVMISKRVGKY